MYRSPPPPSTDEDTVFLAAGFFDGENSAGRHFSISYKNITTATSSDPNSLATEELFRTISANNNWLTFPVTFVGVEKADYDATNASDYQFWFIFLREKLVTDDVIYSRLVRVCRNDPGSMATEEGGARHFSTFMKARIFCDKPSTLEFADTLDYVYNSISKSPNWPIWLLEYKSPIIQVGVSTETPAKNGIIGGGVASEAVTHVFLELLPRYCDLRPLLSFFNLVYTHSQLCLQWRRSLLWQQWVANETIVWIFHWSEVRLSFAVVFLHSIKPVTHFPKCRL